MGSPVPRNFLGRLTFNFSRDEARELMTKKRVALAAKIDERAARITKLKADNGLSDSDIIDVLNQMRRNAQAQTYSISNSASGDQRTITAGTAAAILAEMDAMTAEKKALARLDMLLLFLKNAVEPIVLSDSDLSFLSEAGGVEDDY